MAQDPAGRDKMSTTPIVIAIVAAALVIAGAILYVGRGPDECAEWNKRMDAAIARADIPKLLGVEAEKPEGCERDQ